LAGEYKLKMTECAELCRIALNKHVTPVSRILSIAVKMLKREMPGIRLLVSYADLNEGHEGRIYQASNWVFVGKTGFEAGIMLKGKLTHRRTINSNTARATSGGCNIMWTRVRLGTKENRNINIYYRSMVTSSNASNSSRNLIPRCAASGDIAAPDFQSGEAGEAPSAALQS
jgi:hypothetical protein